MFTLSSQRDPEVVVCFGVSRPQPERLAGAGDGLIVAAAVAKNVAQVVMRVGEVGPHAERLAVTGFGFLSAPEPPQHNPEIISGLCIVGPELHRSLKTSCGFVERPRCMAIKPRFLLRLGVFLAAPEGSLARRNDFLQPSQDQESIRQSRQGRRIAGALTASSRLKQSAASSWRP